MKIAKMCLVVVLMFVFCAVAGADEGKCYSVNSYLIAVDSNVVEKSYPNPLDDSGKGEISILQLGSWLVSDDAEVLATSRVVTLGFDSKSESASYQIEKPVERMSQRQSSGKVKDLKHVSYYEEKTSIYFEVERIYYPEDRPLTVSCRFNYKNNGFKNFPLESGEKVVAPFEINLNCNSMFHPILDKGRIVNISKGQGSYMFLVLKCDTVK